MDLARKVRILIHEMRIPLLVMLVEAAVNLVEDDFRLWVHDSQAVLSLGEVVMG